MADKKVTLPGGAELYLYPAAGSGNSCVLVCPGGGYHHFGMHEGEPVALKATEAGFAAAVLYYTVLPETPEKPLADLQEALSYLRANADALGIGAHRICALGFSAAGHLCACGGTAKEGEKPDAMALCYPVTDFTHLSATAKYLLGKEYENITSAEKVRWSPWFHVIADTCPAFIWHTADDEGVPVHDSILMADALSKANVPFALHIYPHGRHGQGLYTEGKLPYSWMGLFAEWLKDLWR